MCTNAGCAAPLGLLISPDSKAMEKATMGVAQLGSFDRTEQRGEVLKRAQAELAKVVTKDDASKAVRYVPLYCKSHENPCFKIHPVWLPSLFDM